VLAEFYAGSAGAGAAGARSEVDRAGSFPVVAS
jgi:hypothetical protein